MPRLHAVSFRNSDVCTVFDFDLSYCIDADALACDARVAIRRNGLERTHSQHRHGQLTTVGVSASAAKLCRIVRSAQQWTNDIWFNLDPPHTRSSRFHQPHLCRLDEISPFWGCAQQMDEMLSTVRRQVVAARTATNR